MAVALRAAEEPVPTPLDGETLLTTADAEKVLHELPAFKNPQPLKARIKTEVDDLLGSRSDEGVLLLDRPARVLRKFTKPSLKVWLLDGTKIQEYAAKSKMLYVKDFSQAPRALKLIQAAFTGDVKTLKEIFDVYTFKSSKDGKDMYRFVLNRKTGSSGGIYRRIQARLLGEALFFHEIEYVPDAGDKVIERYLEISAVEKPSDADFALDVPADVTRKNETIKGAE